MVFEWWSFRCLGFQDREVFLRFHCRKFPLCDLKVEEIDLGNIYSDRSRGHPKMKLNS